jgi:hypothetical protein
MKLLIPARRRVSPACSFHIDTSSVAGKMLVDRYKRYLRTRDVTWLVKVEATLHHAKGLDRCVEIAHAICNEAWGYEMAQQQQPPDVIRMASLASSMNSLVIAHPDDPFSAQAQSIWYPRQLLQVEELSQAVQQPGFDMRRLEQAGMVMLNNKVDEKPELDRVEGEELPVVSIKDLYNPQSHQEWQFPQDCEQPAVAIPGIRIVERKVADADLLLAAQALQNQHDEQRAAQRKIRIREKRQRQKLAKVAAAAVKEEEEGK